MAEDDWPYAELMLWDVDMKQLQTIDIQIQREKCFSLPELIAGIPYRLNISNPLTSEVSLPFPQGFLKAITPLMLKFAGMKLGVGSIQGLILQPAAKISLDLVAISPGSWSLPCQSEAQQLRIRKTEKSFPAIQPVDGLIPGILRIPRKLHAFQLQNQFGKKFSEQQFKGRWTVLFFGFSSCPEICPSSIQNLTQVYKTLTEEIRQQLDVYFISVDPKQDTPERLNRFISQFDTQFDTQFMAATGSKEQLRNLADQLSANYYFDNDRNRSFNNIAHTADYFLIAPDQRIVARLSYEATIEQLSKYIINIWKYYHQLYLKHD